METLYRFHNVTTMEKLNHQDILRSSSSYDTEISKNRNLKLWQLQISVHMS